LLEQAEVRLARGELLCLVVRRREDGAFAGGVAAIASGPAHAELAYWTAPALRGHGIAGAALALLTDWALFELGLDGVWLEVDPGNVASLAAARAAGFRLVGVDAAGLDNAGRGEVIVAAASRPAPCGRRSDARRRPARLRGGSACLARLRRMPPPEGHRVREATMSDLEETAAVVIAAESADGGESLTTTGEIASDWTSLPRFDPSRDTWLVLDEMSRRPRIVGYAWLWDEIEHTHVVGSVFVHPDARGRGLEAVLLDRLEARAREHAASAPSGETAFGVYTEPESAERVRLFRAHGFHKTREFQRMYKDLAEADPPARSAAGIDVRPFRPGVDDAAVHLAIEEGFADHFRNAPMTLEEFHRHAMEGSLYDPGLWLVAWENDTVVGAVVSEVHEESDSGYVHLLAVRKPWRGRGAGTALLQGTFDLFRARGFSRVVLGVDRDNRTPAVRLYVSAGMTPGRTIDFYEKPVGAPRRG